MFYGQGMSFKPPKFCLVQLVLVQRAEHQNQVTVSRGALFEVRCVVRENHQFIWNRPGAGLSSWNFGLVSLILILQWIFAGVLLLLLYRNAD